MRRLYLHIGLPKTGTTYIQRMLVANEATLLGRGLGIGPFHDPRDGDSRAFRRTIRSEGLDAAAARLDASPGAALLMSSEHLAAALDEPGFARALRDAFARRFDLRLVVFLRRQDRLRESLYAQVVKTWYAGGIEAERHFDLGHDARLGRLEAVFGRARIAVRLYREDGGREGDGHEGGGHEGGGGDVLDALLAATGTAVPRAALGEIGRQNAALHRRKLLFLSQVPKPDPDIQDLSAFMAEVVARSTAIADDGLRFLQSPATRCSLVLEHLAGNRAVAARYRLGEAGDFLALPDPDEPWAPPAPITASEFAAVIAEAAAACRHRNPRLAVRLAAKLAAAAPQMAWRRFGPAAPRPSRRPPRPDMLPAGGPR